MLRFVTRYDQVSGHEWIETDITGKALLVFALLNKGTAFTETERHELNLLGKLPHQIESLEDQLARAKKQYSHYTNTLQKYIYLNNLHDKNEILFYKFLSEDLSEVLPLIYTPGVSTAVQAFSHEFRQPRGLYIAYPDREKLNEILDNRTHGDIDVMVVTDGERILGLGDQGIGGMDIPISKLVIYCLCGANPYKTLPIMLDVGTDNPTLLNDPLYLGWRHPRLRGKEYDDFIQQFVEALKKKFPLSFLHWEDFGLQNARRILETYRFQHCSFNDDMQGTGVVTLAALLAAIHQQGLPLPKQRVVIFGAGTAGMGVADQLYNAMLRHGIDAQTARRQFWMVDRFGLLEENTADLTDFQRPFARPKGEWSLAEKDLFSVVSEVKPTILIGCSTVGKAFTEAIIRKMAANVAKPIIFPLSNPNANCEAHPENVLQWTEGRALIATGSPFEPIAFQQKMIPISQCNNALSFPGIGIGVIATKASQVTDNMLWAATQAIAQFALNKGTGALLPDIVEIQDLACEVALAVTKQAIADNVARVIPDLDQATFNKLNFWKPYYRPIKLVKNLATSASK
ncbi:MAG: NAD-dependent malic enzyme [Candidatus Berkiellales bacterium]